MVAITAGRRPAGDEADRLARHGTRRWWLGTLSNIWAKPELLECRRSWGEVAKVRVGGDQVRSPRWARRWGRPAGAPLPVLPTSRAEFPGVYAGTCPGSIWQRRATISWAAHQTRKSSRLDVPRAVEPPEEAELLDGQEDIASQRFFGAEADEFFGCSGHDRQASRMGRTKRGRPRCP